tara:strand:+ start:57 stop:332 length:276 start_codon:yes stop_codon:yes gene_type:complete
MKQTPVEFLELMFLRILSFDSEEHRKKYKDAIRQAKEMEKQQQDEFAIDFIKWTISKEADDLIHDLQMVGEVSKFPSTEEVLKVYKRFKNL